MQVIAQLGETRQIGHELHKRAVVLDGADHARHRLPYREPRGVLCPCAQQLLVAQGHAVVGDGLDRGIDVHPHRKTLVGVLDARDGDRVDRHERHQSAADIAKGAERLQMRDPRGDHVADMKAAEILRGASLLGVGTGEHRGHAVLLTDELLDDKAHRPADARDHRDIAHTALTDAERALFTRDHAAHTRQIDL